MNAFKETLNQHLPADAVEIINEWLLQHNVKLRIAKKRASKLGDYRPPRKNKLHQITVNGDLNKYAFLIILVHEIAHLVVWEKYKNKIKPHGKQWKEEFRILMYHFTNKAIFPFDILQALTRFLTKGYASTCTDTVLARILKKYDYTDKVIHYIEDIPLNSSFKTYNGKIFRKQVKLRKRYRCICLDNKRIYLFSPLAEVIPLND